MNVFEWICHPLSSAEAVFSLAARSLPLKFYIQIQSNAARGRQSG